ncbi:hypothetical protein WDU94_006391 [Cyamophila willieti]
MKQYTVAVFGSSWVGKTALSIQFVEEAFPEYIDITIEDTFEKEFEHNGHRCQLKILDTASPEVFDGVRDQYIKYISNNQGFVLVYSIDDSSSFMGLRELRDQIVHVKETLNVPMILVGNKCDIEEEYRAVSTKEGETLAKEFKCTFLETSAKRKIHVKDTFYDLVRQIDRLERPSSLSFCCGLM